MQTVLRERLCIRVSGGKLDFPRHASFAAIKMVTWWEAEFLITFKRPSGLTTVGCKAKKEHETDDGTAVIKNVLPSEFILMVVDTADQLLGIFFIRYPIISTNYYFVHIYIFFPVHDLFAFFSFSFFFWYINYIRSYIYSSLLYTTCLRYTNYFFLFFLKRENLSIVIDLSYKYGKINHGNGLQWELINRTTINSNDLSRLKRTNKSIVNS